MYYIYTVHWILYRRAGILFESCTPVPLRFCGLPSESYSVRLRGVRDEGLVWQDGGAYKSECAAAKLRQIFPLVQAKGVCRALPAGMCTEQSCAQVVMSIPMPGHTVAPERLTQTQEAVEQLDGLIK